MPLTYRPDIDGVRAVAVLSVILYHYGATWLRGGFVGVDVFFVISGYLITQIAVRDMALGRFSALDFFTRRARRLLPALVATVAASSMLSFLLFTPADLTAYSRSAVAALLGLSNFTFWPELGYFDAAANSRPLLHTWLLSVEWQFYAFWTCLLVGAAMFKRLESMSPRSQLHRQPALC